MKRSRDPPSNFCTAPPSFSGFLVLNPQSTFIYVNLLNIMATTPNPAYSPLEARIIRLIRLEAGQYDDPIRFSLESVSLDSDPIYEAISYCWGDHTARQEVICQDISMSITTSLWCALREFRDSAQHRILWADGVCINQQNENEKKHQVRLMRDIYATARIVLVWLGPMDEAGLLSNVCASIKQLYEFIPDFDWKLPQEAHQNLVAEMASRDCRGSWSNIEKHDWSALVELLIRPWFTRKWVVQETAMAQEVRLHVAGGVQLSWAHLTSIARKTHALGLLPLISELIRPEHHKALALGVYNIIIMDMISHWRAAGRGTLIDVVLVTRALSCSDHHDHIYGVLSCASEGPLLDPDYALSVEETFKRFAKVMLTEVRSLKVLSLEPHKGDPIRPNVPRNKTELPSWVPDLRRMSPHVLVSNSTRAPLFCAGGPSNPVLSVSDDGCLLRCQGIIVDEVFDFVPSLYELTMNEVPNPIESSVLYAVEDPCPRSRHGRFQRWMRACYDLHYRQASVLNQERRKDAFSCALLCDQGSSAGGEASAEMVSATFEWVEYILSQDCSLSAEQGLGKTPEEEHRLPKLRFAISRAINERCTMRNFSVTTSGRLGQMPLGTEKGDLVCVLMGGEVPFIIRPTHHGSTSYNLIGDCFLNGVMNAEIQVADVHATREIVLV